MSNESPEIQVLKTIRQALEPMKLIGAHDRQTVGERRRGSAAGQVGGTLQIVESREGLVIVREAPRFDAPARRRPLAGERILAEEPYDRLRPFGPELVDKALGLSGSSDRAEAARQQSARRRGLVASGFDLGQSWVGKELEKRDCERNPFLSLSPAAPGFSKIVPGSRNFERQPVTLDELKDLKRILLLVHGTFSNSEVFLRNQDFIESLIERYGCLIAFDHRTLGVDPLLNAQQMHRCLRETQAKIDVICHSRGGLVTRAWLESLDGGDPQERRVVFVGSTLAGTSLASPARLRSCINCLASFGGALAKAGEPAAVGAPFFAAALTLFQIFASVTTLVGHSPALDLAIALVPGLAAQSRVESNRLLIALRQAARGGNDIKNHYFFVRSNFQPEHPHWNFWKYFRVGNLADALVDPIFDGENDLVVDTSSMTDLGEGDKYEVPSSQILDFGTNAKVHHLNYFDQKETGHKIREWLKFE